VTVTGTREGATCKDFTEALIAKLS
jgi:hypothetical protein